MTDIAFPSLGIVTDDLIAEVDRLIDMALKEKPCQAVNYGDLGIADIEYRLSVLQPDFGPKCIVLIEEASPSSGLDQWLYARLDTDKFPRTYFECEW